MKNDTIWRKERFIEKQDKSKEKNEIKQIKKAKREAVKKP
jgi:hypothetical protein